MKKLLNTLFVTTQGSYLSKEGETIVVSVEREVKLRLPIHTVSGIVCFGNVMMSPFLMGFCAEKDVAVSFLTEYGRFWHGSKGRFPAMSLSAVSNTGGRIRKTYHRK
jgi:CRISP-associated protein Cas1